MIPKEILRKIHAIQIHTDHMIDAVIAGEYESVFKGRGMEFEEVREYIPGDDVRTIDWNVTARMNAPYVKLYHEERELTIFLLVDVSASNLFGSHDKLKKDVAAEIAAILAYMAIKNNDKVGVILFTDIVEEFIPPKKGRNHVFRVIREILTHEPHHTQTNISTALEQFLKTQSKKAVCFLISDFIGPGFERHLNMVAKKHDLICIEVKDRRETTLPDVGLIELQDAESSETYLLDTHASQVRAAFNDITQRDGQVLRSLFRRLSVDHVEVHTHANLLDPILKLFRLRSKRH